jgi:hypothetical protein
MTFPDEADGVDALLVLSRLFNLVERGKLVRNTRGDDSPNWTLDALYLVETLVDAKRLLDKYAELVKV